MPSVGKGVEGLELSRSAGGNVKRPFLQKLNIYLPYNSVTSPLGIYLREIKVYVHTKTRAQTYTAVLFIVAQTLKQPKHPSIGKWLETNHIHPHGGILLRNKREQLLIHVTIYMNLKMIVQTKRIWAK